MKGVTVAAVTVLVCLSAASCTPNISPDSYSVGSVGQVNRVVRGVVVSARPVAVSGTNSGVGSGAGAVAGGAGGSAIGGSTDANIVGAVGGAVIGGIVGAAIEESTTRQTGMEYIIEAENGSLITIVQGDEDPLVAGQRVLVIYGTRSRVIKAPD